MEVAFFSVSLVVEHMGSMLLLYHIVSRDIDKLKHLHWVTSNVSLALWADA